MVYLRPAPDATSAISTLSVAYKAIHNDAQLEGVAAFTIISARGPAGMREGDVASLLVLDVSIRVRVGCVRRWVCVWGTIRRASGDRDPTCRQQRIEAPVVDVFRGLDVVVSACVVFIFKNIDQ